MSPIQSHHQFLSVALESDSQLKLIGEDLELRPDSSGLTVKFPDQVHETPASDTTLIGVAVGMAIAGQKVIVQAASAISLPQIMASIPVFGSDFPLTLIVRIPVAPTDVLPLDILLAYPHVQVRCAHSSSSVIDSLQHALSHQGPTIILESLSPQKIYRQPENAHTEIWAWGAGLESAYRAAENLTAQGIECRVHALNSIQPLEASAGNALFETGRVVLVNLPTALLSAIHQIAFWRLEHPPVFCKADTAAIEASVRAVLTP